MYGIPHHQTPTWGRRERWLISLALPLGALAAGAFDLAGPSLWVDEAYSWFFVTMDWPDMAQAVRIDGVNPPFFYVYTKFFTELFGAAEAALRLPSLLAHVIGTFVALQLGARIGGRPGALAAGAFWGYHPLLLWFARDARPYALAATLALLALLIFFRAQRRGELHTAGFVAATSVVLLGLLTHYFFLLFVAVSGLLAALELRRRPGLFRSWSLVLLAALLPLLAWIWWFLRLPQPSFGIGWISEPALLDLPATLWNLVSGYGGSISPGALLFGVTFAVLGLAGLRKGWLIGLLGVPLPLLGVWALSQYRPLYVDRYFAVLLPFMTVLVAAGGLELQRLVGASLPLPTSGLLAAVPAAAALAGALAVHVHGGYAKEDWRSLTAWLDAAPAASVYLSEPEAQLPLEYYGLDQQLGGAIEPAACQRDCLWVLRQPYTATHAFSQAVADPRRTNWRPTPPASCAVADRAPLPATGLHGWYLRCDG